MNEALRDYSFQNRVLLLNALLPLALMIFDLQNSNLGANPPEAIIRTTGVIAIIFLMLTLSVTPYSKLMKQAWVIRHRRWLGLWSFYYGLVHLLSYAVFDKGLVIADVTKDIVKRPFILLGFTALVLMVPLAVTSTNKMIQRLGSQNWRKLHKLIYIIGPIAVAHYWLIVKSDHFYPSIFALVVIGLLTFRVSKRIWHV